MEGKSIEERVASAESRLDYVATREDDAKLRGHIDKSVAELNGHIDKSVAELNGNIDKSVVELNGRIDNSITEIKGHLDKSLAKLQGDLETKQSKSETRTLKFFLTLCVALVGIAAPFVSALILRAILPS